MDLKRLENGYAPANGRRLLRYVDPYVRDGLVAWWDGEWNAGLGRHDGSAAVWRDLVGDRDLTVGSTFRWGANFIRNMGFSECATAANKHIPAAQFRTLELVYRQDIQSLSSTNGSMYFVMDNYSGSTGTGKSLYATGGTLLNLRTASPKKTMSPATFGAVHTATMTYGTGAGALSIYMDGALSTETSSAFYKSYKTTKCLSVGSTDGPVCGRIYCIRVYDRVLSVEEVAANLAVDRARFRAGITGDPWSLEDPEGYVTSQFSRVGTQVQYNRSLVSVSLPNVTGVPNQAFQGCDKLERASMPLATSVGSNSFRACTRLERFNSPHTGMCVFRSEGCTVGSWSFLSDTKLRVFVNVSNSGVGGFGNNPWQDISVRCIKLLATDPPCSTATQLTTMTSITSTCRFYVPDEAVDTYKAHAAYASRASYIYPASEFRESDWWVD